MGLLDIFKDVGKYAIDPTGGLIAGGSDLAGDDANNDFLSTLTGGQTSEEAAIQKAREEALAQAYAEAEGKIGNQYFGGTADKAAELAKWQNLRNDPYFVSTMSEADLAKLDNNIAGLKLQMAQETAYAPTEYKPQTDYDVTGYDPTKVEATSEAKVAHLLEALYPDKLGIPEYEDAAMQSPSEAAKAEADAASLQAAKQALGSLTDVYQQGGMTAIDRARYESARKNTMQEQEANRRAILSDMGKRGFTNSGLRMASEQIAAQDAANKANMANVEMEGLAEQRALDAMEKAGVLGRNLAEDAFRREYDTGSATDEINRFNTLGARDLQADERHAADEYATWNRDKIQRDVDRQTDADVYNADAQTEADKYLADQTNVESQWGANTGNSAAKYNADMATAKSQYDADRAWDQLSNYNTQQSTLGNLAIGKAGGLDAITASQPTADYGQAVRNLLEFGKSAKELATSEGEAKSMITGSGGGGGASTLAFV